MPSFRRMLLVSDHRSASTRTKLSFPFVFYII